MKQTMKSMTMCAAAVAMTLGGLQVAYGGVDDGGDGGGKPAMQMVRTEGRRVELQERADGTVLVVTNRCEPTVSEGGADNAPTPKRRVMIAVEPGVQERSSGQSSSPQTRYQTAPPATGGSGGTARQAAPLQPQGTWPSTTVRADPKIMVGVRFEPVKDALASQLKLETGKSILVTAVLPGLPADGAGVQLWDILLSCNEVSPLTDTAFEGVLAGSNPGDTLNLKVLRGGEKIDLSIKVERYDPVRFSRASMRMAPGAAVVTENADLAHMLDNLPANMREDLIVASAGTNPNSLFHVLSPAPVTGGDGAFEKSEQALQERLDQISDRLDRLERLLEQLAEQGSADDQSDDGDGDGGR